VSWPTKQVCDRRCRGDRSPGPADRRRPAGRRAPATGDRRHEHVLLAPGDPLHVDQLLDQFIERFRVEAEFAAQGAQ